MGTIPALQPFQAPQNQFSIGDTYVQMARMKAYQQQARLDELKLGQEQRKEDRSRLWEQSMGEVYSPQAPAQGLAAPPPPQQAPAPAGGLAMAQAGPQAQMPQGPPQGYAGPPSLAAAAPSEAPLPQPAPPPPQPGAGLATAQAPPPAQAPGGLGQGAGTRSAFQGLLKPMNEEALVRAHRIDPERTEKWFSGMMKMQGDKIKQVKEQNSLVYDTLKAVDRSPNPAGMWPAAVQSLRDKGIPVPKELETFDPAMLKFKLNEHRSADVEAKEAEAEHQRQLARTAEKLGLKHDVETRRTEQQIGLDVKKDVREERQTTSQIGLQSAQAQHALAQTAREKQAKGLDLNKDERAALNEEEVRRTSQQKREFEAETEKQNVILRPLEAKAKALENRYKEVQTDTALSAEARAAELAKITQAQQALNLERDKVAVPQYLKEDADTNTALNQVMKKRHGDAAASKTPDAQDIQDARNLVIQGKIDVAAANQRDAGKSAAIKGVLESAVAKGQGAEDVHSILDDMDDLIRRGTLTSTPSDAWRVYAQKLGLRPTDEAAARTQVLQSLGDQLTLAKAGGKLGGQLSDPDRDMISRATGNFGKLMSEAQQKEALNQLRRSSDRDLEQGNRILKQHTETGTVPEFGQVRKERQTRTIDQTKFDQLLAAKRAQNPAWTRESLIKSLENSKTSDGKDYILRID